MQFVKKTMYTDKAINTDEVATKKMYGKIMSLMENTVTYPTGSLLEVCREFYKIHVLRTNLFSSVGWFCIISLRAPI
jgi:hypothetical protein